MCLFFFFFLGKLDDRWLGIGVYRVLMLPSVVLGLGLFDRLWQRHWLLQGVHVSMDLVGSLFLLIFSFVHLFLFLFYFEIRGITWSFFFFDGARWFCATLLSVSLGFRAVQL